VELPEGALFCPACGKKQIADKRKHRKRANGSGSIVKLSGKRGKPYNARKGGVSIGCYATYAEAQKALERITDVKVTDLFNMTFQQVYDLWYQEHAREISESMMGNYKLAFKQCSQLHDMKIRKIRHSDYQAAIIALEEQGMAKSTCNKLRTLLNQVAAYAMDEGITISNPAENLKTVAKQKSVRKIFTDDDVKHLKSSKLPAAKVALIMISCGCRPGELFTVPLENCYEDHFIWGSKTEKGRNRVIPIGTDGVEAYTEMLIAAKEKGADLLIAGYSGANHDSNNFAKRDWKELMASIGKPDMPPYSCRHTFITRAIRDGVSLPMLESIVGHVDKETTRIYTHLQAEDLVAEVRKKTVGNKLVTQSDVGKERVRKS